MFGAKLSVFWPRRTSIAPDTRVPLEADGNPDLKGFFGIGDTEPESDSDQVSDAPQASVTRKRRSATAKSAPSDFQFRTKEKQRELLVESFLQSGPITPAHQSKSRRTFGHRVSMVESTPISPMAPVTTSLEGQIGSLALPVQGIVLRRANQPDAAGVARPGIIMATRPGAIVTTPAAATIRYSGPLLEFGNVVILAAGLPSH